MTGAPRTPGWATIAPTATLPVSGAVVAFVANIWWLECSNCGRGSVRNGPTISPGVSFGPQLQGLPPAVEAAYQQARRSMSVEAYTGAELVCRKILMHVAVEKGAKAGTPSRRTSPTSKRRVTSRRP